jgi:hypothetical protein
MKIFLNSSLILLLSAFLFNACDMSADMQPKGNYISGHLSFIDTNFAKSGGHYAIGLYLNQTSPFLYKPAYTQVINPDILNTSLYYRIICDGQGSYIVSAIWMNDSCNEVPEVLGTFGCDTSRTCTSPDLISFPNYTGADYLFSCWADTCKKLN